MLISPKLVRLADSYIKKREGKMMAETANNYAGYGGVPPNSRLPPDGHEFPGDYLDDGINKLRTRSGSNGGLWKGSKVSVNGRDEPSERSVKDKIALFTHETPQSNNNNNNNGTNGTKKYPSTLSCSVDNLTSGRSPMISPVIRTLPRPSHIPSSSASSSTIKNNCGGTDLNERSRSLLDVTGQRRSTGTINSVTTLLQQRKSSLTNLSEHPSRRKSSFSSKLRGLVIPAADASVASSQQLPSAITSRAALELPEIISKDSVLVVGLSPLMSSAGPLRSPTGNEGITSQPESTHQTKTSTSLSSLPWKSNSPSMPKYSPAFKRKDLSVLRGYNNALALAAESASVPPVPSTKPPPVPSLSQQLTEEPISTTEGNNNNNNNDNSDTDGDSAVSSSRSSFSPSGSPLPERTAQAETSARILKAQSVEALNRKNVLHSARISSGVGGNGVTATVKVSTPSSPLPVPSTPTGEAAGSRIERSAPRLRLSSSERLEVKTAFMTDVCDDHAPPVMTKFGSSTPPSTNSFSLPRKSTTTEVNSFRALAQRWEAIANETPMSTTSTAILSTSSVITSVSPTNIKPNKPDPTEPLTVVADQNDISFCSPATSSSSTRSRATGVMEIRQAFERVREELENADSSSCSALDYVSNNGGKPHSIFNLPGHYHHVRMNSLDSMTSEEGGMSFPFGGGYGGGGPFGVRDNYGSITSLASSTSLISPQELQQLLDDANQSLEESGTPSHEIVVVVLHRGDFCTSSTLSPGLGITLAGGADYETKEITIHKVIGGSVADRDGRVQKGDRVLSINGKGLKGVTHREALSILKAPRPEVVLVLSRNRSVSPQEIGRDEELNIKDLMTSSGLSGLIPASLTGLHQFHRSSSTSSTSGLLSGSSSNRPPRILESPLDFGNFDAVEDVPRGPSMTTTLVKDGAGLGFSLEGGKDSPLGDRPLTIKKIFTGGAASKNPTLSVGDQILSVNGCDVTVMSRIEAWNLMKKLPDGVVTLVIRQQIASS